jgi:DNA-binding beta-propeller fold protein YncE
MRKRVSFIVTAAVALMVVFVVGNRLTSVQGQGQATPTRVAAVPGEKGGQDMYGAYEVVAGWPKPLSSVPGVGQWTWGAGQGVFAETPNRVFVLERGMLPEIGRPKPQKIAPSVEFPIGRLPWRDATSASPPGMLFKPGTQDTTREPGDDLDVGQPGVDYKWGRIINVIDAQGNHIEDWTQYDKMFRRPHSVFESPYDPQKDVWIVDDYRHAIFRFSNDGKKLLQTIGTVNVPGNDSTHFYRPTFMAWAPNGDFYVADGYQNTRVVKFDKTGKYLMTWGERGEAGKETRPSFFNNVHGVAVDPQTGNVFVNDRGNRRIQKFDANGKYIDSWSVGKPPADIHLVYMDGSRMLWAFDRASSKMIKYDLNGNLQYTFGMWGPIPGGFWGVHGMHVDSEGNLYVAEVDNGGAQKFAPRPGANPAFLLTKPPAPAAGTR